MSVPFDLPRKKNIEQQVKLLEDSAGGKDKLPCEKIVIKGRATLFPVYKLHTADLFFNRNNGRIRAEVLQLECERGTPFISGDSSDEIILRDLLLKNRPDENNKIELDLITNGQISPGIITCDGVLINGNRRKAILDSLFERTQKQEYAYIEVQVLPPDVTPKELWLLEAGIQLSTPRQLDYSPINQLLKIRDGINSGIAPKEMVQSIYGIDDNFVKESLQRLDLIDEYLECFLCRKEQYHLIANINEHFIDLQNMLSWARRPRGTRINWDYDETDINEFKLVVFYYIRAGWSHLRIRDLRDYFSHESSWKKLKTVVNINHEQTGETADQAGVASTTDSMGTESQEENGKVESEDGFEEDIKIPDDTTYEYNSSDASRLAEAKERVAEKAWQKKNKSQLQSAFEEAKEERGIIEDQETPIKLLVKARRNIEAVPEEVERLTAPEIDNELRLIIVKANKLRKLTDHISGDSLNRKRKQRR